MSENHAMMIAMYWRPIETAPKDGSEFDVWRAGPNGEEGERVADVRYKKVRIGISGKFQLRLTEWAPDELGYMRSQKIPYDHRVTHWMPKPPPPEES